MRKWVVCALLLVLSVSFADATGSKEKKAEAISGPLKVGFIYIGSADDRGYIYAHEQSAKAAEEYFGSGIEVIRKENVPENEACAQAMGDLISAGCRMIFATSYNYQQYVLRVASNHPKVYFEHCSGMKRNNSNISTYFGRMYQIRYLTGMVAGAMSKSGNIGYVAAFKTPEVFRGINAFTLGVKSVNPDAVVNVIWTNSWYNPQVERDAALKLLDQGVDLIAQHENTTEPAKAALERGKYAIGYDADFRSILSDDKVLCSAEWNWSKYVIPAIQSVLDDKFMPQSYWGGSNQGIVFLSSISPLVPNEFQTKVHEKAEELKKGSFGVFWGELTDNEGTVRQKAGGKMSDDELLSMNWLVDGVVVR